MSVFSERLKALRMENGIKQAEIAAKLGVSVQSYSAYENGREPNYDILAKLSKLLGTTSDYLIGLSDATQPENTDIVERLGLTEEVIDILSDIKEKSKKRRKELLSDGLKASLLSIDIINRFIWYGSQYELFEELSDICTWMEYALLPKSEDDDKKNLLDRFFVHGTEKSEQIKVLRVLAEEYDFTLIDKDDLIEYKTFIANGMYHAALNEVLRPIQQPYLEYINGVVDDGDD